MENSKINAISELDLLTNISKALTENIEPASIVDSLNNIFNNSINSDKVEIYIYDDKTKTLKDFSKSWIIVEDLHKNKKHSKFYSNILSLNKSDFIFNDKALKLELFFKSKNFKINQDINTIIFPLIKGNKPYGLIKLIFKNDISKILTPDFFKTLSIAAYQISFKIQNTILAEQMQINIDFHEAMKNIAKIIETQYELNYIIPLIGEMVDRFIPEHLIYIFLRNEDDNGFTLVWPKACRDERILSRVAKITAKSKYLLTNEDKIGIFPLIGEKLLLGCIVAHSNIDKLSKKEIDYLEQLTKQSSITIHRANVYAEILKHATLDALTGLNNRRQFEIRLNQEVATAKRQGKALCAMMLDVDFFKKVNDTYGHIVGDCVLKEIAQIIKKELREYDIPSRYGGEEFAVLLPYTKIEEAFAVAQRLRHAVENTPIDIIDEKGDCNLSIKTTISIGVYEYKKDDTPQDLYKKADNALYEAKTHGRNKVFISQ
jgi:diguanylate cyclase (GGDEF)-like protein